ncbi:hypothetical protein IGI04_040927 [Brassica rapa subsp. trilocularis]|uniref:SHSP domain-containing protein n=1 Tax=Brassica rapa subsp. trilocularis TaxID=1813537 RepID=A0ABQ7KS56_BRACM|nr:hypothetical protein IGI04_040927 [Brassica rapa subsp. trilocularis]
MAAYIDMSRIPYIPGRLHATNNPYQRYGPKGFMEIKVLHNDNLYVRVDLPGVPDDAIRYRVDAVRQKVVFFSGEETLRDGYKADDVREYSGTAGLGCDCCEITGVEAKMKDGVLRMILARVKVKDHDKKCTRFLPPNTGKSGRYDVNSFNCVEVEGHPFVVKGRKDTLASHRTSDGCYHFSVDMPGVCGDDMFVIPNENEIKFYGENKEVCMSTMRVAVFSLEPSAMFNAVSHHPPMSAGHAENEHFTYDAPPKALLIKKETSFCIVFCLSSCSLYIVKKNAVDLVPPLTKVHNLIFGRTWVWHVADVPKNDKFQYTHFGHKINSFDTAPSKLLASDSRLRPVRYALEQADLSKDTLRIGFCINIINESFLEERQRAENKTRETKNQKFTPRWFDLTDEITSTPWGDTEIYQYNGKYTEHRDAAASSSGASDEVDLKSIEFNPWQYGNVSTE